MRDATSMTPAAAGTILAIDLGKFRSVACRYDAATGSRPRDTIPPARSGALETM